MEVAVAVAAVVEVVAVFKPVAVPGSKSKGPEQLSKPVLEVVASATASTKFAWSSAAWTNKTTKATKNAIAQK